MKKIKVIITLLCLFGCGNRKDIEGTWFAYSYADAHMCQIEISKNEIQIYEGEELKESYQYKIISKGFDNNLSYVVMRYTHNGKLMSAVYDREDKELLELYEIKDAEYPFDGFIQYVLRKDSYPDME